MYDKMNSQSEKGKKGMKVLLFVLFTVLFQLYWAFFGHLYTIIAVILFGERYSGVITAIAIISSLVCAIGTSSYLYKKYNANTIKKTKQDHNGTLENVFFEKKFNFLQSLYRNSRIWVKFTCQFETI